jgi:hypothetical protein
LSLAWISVISRLISWVVFRSINFAHCCSCSITTEQLISCVSFDRTIVPSVRFNG